MRRGRIPVANFRSEEHKNRSRSRVREPDYNKNDPIDCDNFTLIEDNIALREDNKTLKMQIKQQKLENEKCKEELQKLRKMILVNAKDDNNEVISVKAAYNSVELQLYEAHEKIAEMLEFQHHLEKEVESLKVENTNLTRVAQLLTENMKESVKTSQKMEGVLKTLKKKNEELRQKSHDYIDSFEPSTASTPDSPIFKEMSAELRNVQAEIDLQKVEHGERVVEMQKILDKTLEKTTNEEITVLKLKLEILEKQLQLALDRAETAENELRKLTKTPVPKTVSTKPSLPPPPPPPLPKTLLYTNNSFKEYHQNHQKPLLNDHCKIQSQQQVESTGLDALVRELKSGTVTLRRARRKTRTNEALQEMFSAIELSRECNRNSQIILDMTF
ncbi:KIAA1598 family protein [Megaselia abdita]